MDEEQYKNLDHFYKLHSEIGIFNIQEYLSVFSPEQIQGKKILDVGCGEGNDLMVFKSMGAIPHGIDINKNAIISAQKKIKTNNNFIKVAHARDTLFPENTFDYVVSNYVLQGIKNIHDIHLEVHRVLKPGGTFVLLVTHPMRQYFERKNISENYFEQTIVDSIILNETLTVKEPTHTMNEYLSNYFLTHFNITIYKELHDPTAEKIDGRTYPGFFILVANKK